MKLKKTETMTEDYELKSMDTETVFKDSHEVVRTANKYFLFHFFVKKRICDLVAFKSLPSFKQEANPS